MWMYIYLYNIGQERCITLDPSLYFLVATSIALFLYIPISSAGITPYSCLSRVFHRSSAISMRVFIIFDAHRAPLKLCLSLVSGLEAYYTLYASAHMETNLYFRIYTYPFCLRIPCFIDHHVQQCRLR